MDNRKIADKLRILAHGIEKGDLGDVTFIGAVVFRKGLKASQVEIRAESSSGHVLSGEVQVYEDSEFWNSVGR